MAFVSEMLMNFLLSTKIDLFEMWEMILLQVEHNQSDADLLKRNISLWIVMLNKNIYLLLEFPDLSNMKNCN